MHYHDAERKAQVSLKPTAELIAQADDERLAEDLRLLYVALTRAQHACWLGVADLKRGNHNASVLHLSALGYLLGGGAVLGESTALNAGCWTCRRAARRWPVKRCQRPTAEAFQPPRNEAILLAPRLPKRSASEYWWIASYSALRIGEAQSADTDEAPERPPGAKTL